MTTVWKVIRSFTALESGHWCRLCGKSIATRDGLGVSESVCAPCRSCN
jgi:hypothetical protein